MNKTDVPPHHGRLFYFIDDSDDDTVDVYLAPIVQTYETDLGITERDISVIVVRGVIPWIGMEDDIRRRYDAWCASGVRIDL